MLKELLPQIIPLTSTCQIPLILTQITTTILNVIFALMRCLRNLLLPSYICQSEKSTRDEVLDVLTSADPSLHDLKKQGVTHISVTAQQVLQS